MVELSLNVSQSTICSDHLSVVTVTGGVCAVGLGDDRLLGRRILIIR